MPVDARPLSVFGLVCTDVDCSIRIIVISSYGCDLADNRAFLDWLTTDGTRADYARFFAQQY
jgi:hypothetical protein